MPKRIMIGLLLALTACDSLNWRDTGKAGLRSWCEQERSCQCTADECNKELR